MDREERIRQLAYEIWEREGHPQGRDAEHWRTATEVYEAELAGSRLDDAGRPIGMGQQASRERTMRSPAASPKARRGRKPLAETAPAEAETATTTKRKRRTNAEMAAAAAGVAGAAAAVAATVVVAKRRRAVKAESTDAAAVPAANVALRRPRKSRSGTTLSEAEPASAAVVSDTTTGGIPDPSADGPSDVAAGPVPDPGAEAPPDAALESFSPSAPDAASAG